jgi:3-isopropylmalate/(R)-2-methylmalate dehydratase small subunit
VIAPSFADIFYNNCCQTGLLPIRLTDPQVADLFRRCKTAADGYELTADLERQEVTDAGGFRARFEMDRYRREMLLRGLDEIGRTLLDEPEITAFEQRREGQLGRPA